MVDLSVWLIRINNSADSYKQFCTALSRRIKWLFSRYVSETFFLLLLVDTLQSMTFPVPVILQSFAFPVPVILQWIYSRISCRWFRSLNVILVIIETELILVIDWRRIFYLYFQSKKNVILSVCIVFTLSIGILG